MSISKDNKKVTDEQIALYDTITPLLKSLYNEIKDFSKKNQNDPLNDSKVKIINRLLVKAKEVLKNESAIIFLDLLDETQLPSTSDAVLVVSQYIAALDTFHTNNFHWDNKWEEKGHWN